MLSRSVRAETRQSRKEDIKRVMHSIDKVRLSWLSVITRVITGHLSQVRNWEKRWVVIPETTMKQFKWIPVSDLIQKTKKPDRKKLFNGAGEEAENSRTSLGMDEDSNMSNISTASDSLDGPPTLTALIKPETSSEDGGTKRTTITAEGGIYKGELSEEGSRQGRGEYIWPNGDR